MNRFDELREELLERRTALLARTRAVERDLRRRQNPDSEERVTEGENDEVLEGLDAAGRQTLGQIDDALRRFDEGTYGVCESCGETIPLDRLRAVPFTRGCIRCAGGD